MSLEIINSDVSIIFYTYYYVIMIIILIISEIRVLDREIEYTSYIFIIIIYHNNILFIYI